MVLVYGDVDAVKAAIEAGKGIGSGYVIDELMIPNVHTSILPAMTSTVPVDPQLWDALGIVETFSVSSAIKAADAAAKAADIILYKLHLAMAIGGKGYFCFTGDIASVRAASDAAVESAGQDGMLAAYTVIPRPREELFQDII